MASASPSFTNNEHSHYTGPFSSKAKFSTPDEEFDWASTQHKCWQCGRLPFTSFGFNTAGKDPLTNMVIAFEEESVKCVAKRSLSGRNKAKKLAKTLLSHSRLHRTCCELCGKTDNIVFDHHHEKNIFRGWLCNGCNRSIGMLGENLDQILKVVNYLNKTEQKIITLNTKGEFHTLSTND